MFLFFPQSHRKQTGMKAEFEKTQTVKTKAVSLAGGHVCCSDLCFTPTDSRNIDPGSARRSTIQESAEILHTPSRPRVGGGRSQREEKMPPCTRARRKFIALLRDGKGSLKMGFLGVISWHRGKSVKFAQTKQRLVEIVFFFWFVCFQVLSNRGL